MIEQVVSPGVYTYENDQSFIAPGQSQTGLAVVGPTEKGQAFVPTEVTSYADFVSKFGTGNATYVPQTVFSYLQAGSSVKVTRVLGNGGWLFSNTKKIAAITTGSTILAVFHPSKNIAANVADLNGSTVTGTYGAFNLTLSGSGVYKQVSSSLTPSSATYVTKVLGGDENFETGSAFPYLNFGNYFTASVSAGSAVTMSLTSTTNTFTSSYAEGYDNAKTPWILSDAGVRLFRIHHLSHGFKTNRDIKIQIGNIITSADPSVYTRFDVLVRAWNDTDNAPSVIEQYIGVSLDPSSPNFIGSTIGDMYNEYSEIADKVVGVGDYPNLSKYIRLEMTEGVKNGSVPSSVKPNGFEAVMETIAGFAGMSLPTASFKYSNTGSSTPSGFDYSNIDNINYLNPIPSEATVGNNAAFVLPVNDNKFILPLQGGTDGMNIATIKKIGAEISNDGTNVFGFDLSTSSTGGTAAYQKAFNILSNGEDVMFDVLAVPGVLEQYHSSVTALAQNMVEERTDALYIRDLTGVNASVATAIAEAAGIDSSYTATYFPWVKVKDLTSTRDIFVPPSVVVPQAIAYNDRIGAEWFAPAGLNRGGLGGVIDTKMRLSKAERDALYIARINPITKFPNSGVVIYGQKTQQVRDTALNRINVRRLLISTRRYISDVSKGLVFEQNTIQTRNKFLSIVNPYLESVQNRQGLYAFRVVMDETNNTADVIDRNQLVGKIYLQPTKTAEFIILEFNIQPTGASFS